MAYDSAYFKREESSKIGTKIQNIWIDQRRVIQVWQKNCRSKMDMFLFNSIQKLLEVWYI